jgi:soluble lytic murein transglycosylase-like protein
LRQKQLSMFRGILYARSIFALGLVLISATPCRADSIPLSAVPISVFAATLRSINPHLAVAQSLIYAQALLTSSRRWRLDPSLVMALVAVESTWNTHAVSYSGAQGLGQLKPETARGLGVDPHQVHGNLNGTTRYLHQLMRVFHSSRDPIRDALAGYNAGPETVRVYGGVPPIYETQRYVVKVMGTWHVLRHRIEAHAPKAVAAAPGTDSSALAYWGVR